MSSLTNRRILVTGSSGFLGSAVMNVLRNAGCTSALALTRSDCDLRDSHATSETFRSLQPDIVLHLAARVGGIGANMAYPADFCRENIQMDTNVLHACATEKVQKVVCIGSVCAYPAEATLPFREDTMWDGYPEESNAAYGLEKRMLLTLSVAYRKQYGLSSIYLIPANLYGTGDHFDAQMSHVIPALVQKFCDAAIYAKKEVTLWGDGSPTRDFLHVNDAADAIVTAAMEYDDPLPLNLGGTGEISIRDLADLIASATGYSGRILWDTSKPNGQKRRAVDSSRAVAAIGFRHKRTLEEGLTETIAWYRKHLPASSGTLAGAFAA